MNAGKSLAVLRNSKGWNQSQLAEAAGVTQATISQLENGERKAGKDLAERLSIALGTALPKDIIKDILYAKIKRLSPKSAEHLNAIVDAILKGENRT